MPFSRHHDVSLRQAFEADLPAIHQLLQQVGLAQPPQSADLRFWLAERDGLVLGCVAALDLGSNWLVRSLAVVAEANAAIAPSRPAQPKCQTCRCQDLV